MHRYRIDIFSYSDPLGILGSDHTQNTALDGARCEKPLHVTLVLINRLYKTESAVFLYCRFSLF